MRIMAESKKERKNIKESDIYIYKERQKDRQRKGKKQKEIVKLKEK